MTTYISKRRHSLAQPRVVVGGFATLSGRQKRATLVLPEGKVRCDECQSAVPLRADGMVKNHRVGGRTYGYPCLAGGTDRYDTE